MKYEVAEVLARMEGTNIRKKYCEKCTMFYSSCKGIIDINHREARFNNELAQFVEPGRTSDGDLCPYAPRGKYLGWKWK